MDNYRFDISIEKLLIENFRGFEHLEITFDKNLTVLIGINGSGKSSVLDLLAENFRQLVHRWFQLGKENYFLEAQKDVKYGSSGVSVNNLSFLISYPYYGDGGQIAITQQTDEAELRLASGEVANFVTLFANESTHQVILNELGDIFGKIRRTDLAKIRLPILAYYQSIGLSQNRIEEGKDTFSTFVWNTYDDLLENRGTSFKNLKKWFEWSQKLDYQLQEQGEGGASFHKKTEIIYQDILQMLNDEENTFTKIYIDWKKSTEGEFVIVKNGNNLKENQLSSGEKLLFTLVADISYKLALANPSSLNPSKEGTGIVLIDEIDLHLHPKWQRKVVTKLREIFPNVQFVITTHSPVILTELYSKHIRVLDNGHIFGIRDSFGHSEEEMLEEMGGQSERKKLIKEIHRLLAQNKISEAKEKRAKIEVEGDFAPLLEIDLFIQRKEKATL